MPASNTANTDNALAHYNEILRLTYRNLVEFMAVYTAVDLLIPDIVGDASADADQLASRAGLDRDALESLMKVLARAGLCDESYGRFALTAAGMALRSDVKGSMRGWVMFVGSQMYMRVGETVVFNTQRQGSL